MKTARPLLDMPTEKSCELSIIKFQEALLMIFSCIFMACVFVYVIVLTILGPEFKGRKMDAASDHDLQEARGIRDAPYEHDHSGSDEEKGEKAEKL